MRNNVLHFLQKLSSASASPPLRPLRKTLPSFKSSPTLALKKALLGDLPTLTEPAAAAAAAGRRAFSSSGLKLTIRTLESSSLRTLSAAGEKITSVLASVGAGEEVLDDVIAAEEDDDGR